MVDDGGEAQHMCTRTQAYFKGEKVRELRVVKESAITLAREEFTSGSDAVP